MSHPQRTLVVVGRGVGMHLRTVMNAAAAAASFAVVVVDVPEPTDDFAAGLAALTAALKDKSIPDTVSLYVRLLTVFCLADVSILTSPVQLFLFRQLLIACSRGGKYAAELLHTGAWTGPTMLCSAMSTTQACSAKVCGRC